MNRTEKSEFVTEIKGRFERAPLVILTEWIGSNVDQMNKFRRGGEALGVHFEVVKNTLCRRAIAGTPHEGLAPYFKGNVGVLFSGDDPIAAVKFYKDSIRENEKFAPRGGWYEGEIFDQKAVLSVADMPSKAQMLAQVLGLLQAGPRSILYVVQAPGRDLLNVLSNHASKLEAAGSTEG